MKTEFLKIVEDLNSLMEDELVDEFTDIDVENTSMVPQTIMELTLTDELDAKAKISRSLDGLKMALEMFKSATLTEINLIQDTAILEAIENLDKAVESITVALGGKLNPEPDFASEEDSEETDMENEEPSEDSEKNTDEEPELNFEDEAELDIFGSKE